MIYKFRIISSENDAFIREIAINSYASFFDLHTSIVEELSYEQSQVTAFFLTDQNWHKEAEITLIDMTDGQDPNIKVMGKTKLGELITEKKQRLLFVFDQFTERSLFLELYEITDGETSSPLCIRRQGNPPLQFDETALESGDINSMDLDELLKEDDSSEFPENDGDMDMPDEEDWY
jgi:hypothetical protein